MFDGILKDNLQIYAITATNAEEDSWKTYCYPNDQVNGVHINSCLGDLFSVNWMEDSDAQNVKTESLSTQFDYILKTTAKSHVMKYGTQTFTKEPVGNFQGNFNEAAITEAAPSFFERLLKKAKNQASASPIDAQKHISAIPSRYAKMHHLFPSHEDLHALKSRIEEASTQ